MTYAVCTVIPKHWISDVEQVPKVRFTVHVVVWLPDLTGLHYPDVRQHVLEQKYKHDWLLTDYNFTTRLKWNATQQHRLRTDWILIYLVWNLCVASDVTSIFIADVLNVHDDILDELTWLAQDAERFAPKYLTRHIGDCENRTCTKFLFKDHTGNYLAICTSVTL